MLSESLAYIAATARELRSCNGPMRKISGVRLREPRQNF